MLRTTVNIFYILPSASLCGLLSTQPQAFGMHSILFLLIICASGAHSHQTRQNPLSLPSPQQGKATARPWMYSFCPREGWKDETWCSKDRGYDSTIRKKKGKVQRLKREKKKSFHFVPINHLDNCTGPQHIHKQTHRVLIAAFVLYI